jgi:tRNA G18 (ribose-2'-O)-methylase SpoU
VESIDDPADARLADYRELRDPSARRRIEGDEMFIAEGPTSIERLLDSGHRLRSVLLTPEKFQRMRELLEPIDAPVYCVERAVLRDIVGFDLHRGAIAAADRRRPPTLDDVLASTDRIGVLEGLNDPENLGAIARSARAFGVGALVLDPTCIDPYTRRTVRVSMGEILFLPAHRVDRAEWPGPTFDRLHAAGFETWAMTPGSSASDIWDVQVGERLAVVLGAEGPGLDAATIAAANRRVRLPIDPDVDSLNVGAAAATFAIIDRPR